MASIQKLNPIIDNLYKSVYLRGSSKFSGPGLAVSEPGVYGSVASTLFDFFEALYLKSISIVPPGQGEPLIPLVKAPIQAYTDITWIESPERETVGLGHSQYVPDKNAYGLILNSFSITDKRDWDEFQYMIDKAYYVLQPTAHMHDLPNNYQVMLMTRAGLVRFCTKITATDGTVVAGGLTAGTSFINAWNNTLVPYQASLNKPVFYIAGIADTSPANIFYRKTGQIKTKASVVFPV